MRLIATYSFYYGRKGPNDGSAVGDYPLVQRGEEFEVLPTSHASSAEVAAVFMRNGTAVTQEVWEKRKKVSDMNWRWAQEETDRNLAAYANSRASRVR